MRISDWSSDVCSSDLVDLAVAVDIKELVRRQRDVQTAAEGSKPLVELLSPGLVGKKDLELLHVFLVGDLLEEVPELVVELREPADLLPNVVHRAGEVLRFEAFEGTIGGESAVELAEQAFIVQGAAELLLLQIGRGAGE